MFGYFLLTVGLIFLWIKVHLLEIKVDKLTAPGGSAKGISFFVSVEGQKRKVSQMNMRDTEKVTLSIEVDDGKGNPGAAIFGLPVWSATDPSLVDLAPSGDGMSCDVVAKGPIGDVTVQVLVHGADDGSDDIMGTLDLTIVASQAATVQIKAATPVPQ